MHGKATTSHVDLLVTGEPKLHCTGCGQRISKVLRRIDGAASAPADASAEKVRVAVGGDVDPQELKEPIHAAGYDSE